MYNSKLIKKYQASEALGRVKLDGFLQQIKADKIQFTKRQFDRIDCFFTLKGKKIGAEIKNRDKSVESFDTYIMEKSKLDYMDLLISKGIKSCWMIYFFGDNMYIFKYYTIKKLIRKHIIYKHRYSLPKSTVENLGNKYVDVYMLPKEYATKFTKIDGRWKLITKSKKL